MTVKDAYITRELSELLGIAPKNVIARAKRESWTSRPLSARGGGNEWLLESMPEATRHTIATAIASRIAQGKSPAMPAPALFTVNTLARVPERKRERAAARALLVSMAREFGAASGTARTSAHEVFCHQYNQGVISVPDWARRLVPSVCRASLCNWEDAILKKGVASLAGRHGQHRKGKGVIDATPGMADYIVSEIIEFYEVSAASVMEALEARFEGQRLPDLRTLQRWMARYRADNEQVIKKIQNPDGWRSKYQSAAGSRSAGLTRANQLWEMDSSPTDVILADGARYTLLGCIDVSTRRGMLHLARTSSAQGVCSLLRRALLAFGVPESIKMDNGSDYTSVQVTTVVHDLSIVPDWCKPFTPEEKPHIERFFRTFQHGFCVRLPGFIGHSVADRKAIESRRSFAERVSRKSGENEAMELRYTPEQFQEICDAWCRDNYNERTHSELGMSPNDAAALAGGAVHSITDERALDILLMPLAGNGGKRTVSKKGLRVEGGTYNAARLGGLERAEVLVRRDEHDAGYVYVFDLDGLFLCRAEDPALTGVSLRELALARKVRQKAVIGEKVKEAKRIVREQKPQETVALILDHKARQAESKRVARAAASASSEPEAHTTPALDQAAIAAMASAPKGPAPMTPEEEAARAAFEARYYLTNIPEPEPETTLQDLTGREAFWMATKLEEKIRDREPMRPEQVKWLHGYQSSHYYHSWRAQYDRFGEALFDGIKVAVAL